MTNIPPYPGDEGNNPYRRHVQPWQNEQVGNYQQSPYSQQAPQPGTEHPITGPYGQQQRQLPQSNIPGTAGYSTESQAVNGVQGCAQSGYTQQGYPTGPNAGYLGSSAGHIPMGQQYMQGTGKVSIGTAINYGFKATFASPTFWLLSTFVILVLSVMITFVLTPSLGVISSIICSLATIFYCNVAIRQLNFGKAQFSDLFDNVNFLPAAGFSIMLSIISAVIFIPLTLKTQALSQLLQSGKYVVQSQIVETLIELCLYFFLTAVFLFLLSPFYTFTVWYILDRRANFVDAIKLGIIDGARNYFQLLGLQILAFLLLSASIILFAVTLIFVIPAIMLSMAHAYRQMSGGAVPVVV